MNNREKRVGETNYNKQGTLMMIVDYTNYRHIIVEFQDKYKVRVNTTYGHFVDGTVRNPYDKNVYGVGMIGNKHPATSKEYGAWNDMIRRCYCEKYKLKKPAYKDVTCCDEWLLFDNFYEWLHSQKNFEQWLNGKQWNVEKDIIVKGNKIYSPETCCLVPNNVNKLFIKSDALRGDLPVGVTKAPNGFQARCMNPFIEKKKNLGYYNTPLKAFLAYKKYKEDLIKQIAQIEYGEGNITKRCYEAMMNYEVEVTD